jgi:hypothetical protein
MDWSNERYVRVYTRDTHDLIAVGFEGRAVFYELLRKVDRAGVLDHGGDLEVLPELLRIPADVFQLGLARLKRRRVLRLTSTAIVIPNFLEAQDAPQSDAQRKREERARRRDFALSGGPPEDRQVSLDSVTEPDANVTSGHSVPCRADPDLSRAVPIRAVPTLALPPFPEGPDQPEVGGGAGGSFVRDPEAVGATFIAAFNADFETAYEPVDFVPLVARALARGRTEGELKAAIWYARTFSDEARSRTTPKSILERVDEYLPRASELWRREQTSDPPWVRKANGVHP